MKPVSVAAADAVKNMEEIVEPGGHSMLVYDGLAALRQVYSQCARKSLSKNEIVMLATQYESVDRVKGILMDTGVDVPQHVSDGTLFVIDAQRGYCGGDVQGTFKLVKSLLSRAKKEKRRGLTAIGDMGSFFGFHRIHDMMDYELSLPGEFESMMRALCCYHAKDFDGLNPQQKEALLDHHGKAIIVK